MTRPMTIKNGIADPMRLLFVQNCPEEGIGTFADRLQDLAVPWLVVHPYAGERLPPLDLHDAIIVGGTPVSANAAGKKNLSHLFPIVTFYLFKILNSCRNNGQEERPVARPWP
jgi:hypothetical protein